ncbi:MAG: hypothetical protein JXN59_08315 [Anaerolineae bacterium]|nr:hypothetical protein [Anaerolineae bacterium]
MPTWTTMNELVTGDLVTEADMAALRENISYLLAPNRACAFSTAGNITTTSNVFVEIDPDNLRLSLQTHGGPVLVSFIGSMAASATTHRVYIDLEIDGVRYAGTDYGLIQQGDAGSGLDNARPVTFTALLADLPAGTHTITLLWRVSAGGAFTLLAQSTHNPAILTAIEL